MRLSIEPKILYFGTPVILVSTLNEDQTVNLAPMSSAWALDQSVVLGLSSYGKTFENLKRTRECVLNIPSPQLWKNVEKLAPLTGKNPIPDHKKGKFSYEKEKFRASRLTPIPSEIVKPPAVKECPLQFEAKVNEILDLRKDERDSPKIIITRIVKVFAHEEIIINNNYINPESYSPLIYNFRHYFGLGVELGKTFRSET